MAKQYLFDWREGQRRKQDGMETAADSRREWLRRAKEAAVAIALTRTSRLCTADDVQIYMVRTYPGYDPCRLGPAAGSIFKDKKEWLFTGKRIPSAQIRNHGRELKVWKLVG